MPNKRIDQLRYNTNPSNSDVFPQVNFISGDTTQLSFGDFIEYLKPNIRIKHWEENQNKIVISGETIVISGNYVLENTNLTLDNGETYIIGGVEFNKNGQIFIGGNLLVKDSNIINNGLISVAGGIIMSGDSTITGTGIIN
jgi:hypothetical protein